MDGNGTGRFEIGSVLSRSFETIGANLPLFAGLAAILSGIPGIVINWWQTSNLFANGQPVGLAFFSGTYLLPILVGWLVSMISGTVLQVALTRATVTHLSGGKPDFQQCLMAGLTMIVPMIGIAILLSIGLMIGFLLLIVPGILLWLAWSVTVPVYVQERTGITEAFGRSRALTKGSRGGIFLVFLVIGIGLWLLSLPIGFVTRAAMVGSGSILVSAIPAGFVAAVAAMITVTVQSSIYVELRNAKDGVAPADLEAIFA